MRALEGDVRLVLRTTDARRRMQATTTTNAVCGAPPLFPLPSSHPFLSRSCRFSAASILYLAPPSHIRHSVSSMCLISRLVPGHSYRITSLGSHAFPVLNRASICASSPTSRPQPTLPARIHLRGHRRSSIFPRFHFPALSLNVHAILSTCYFPRLSSVACLGVLTSRPRVHCLC